MLEEGDVSNYDTGEQRKDVRKRGCWERDKGRAVSNVGCRTGEDRVQKELVLGRKSFEEMRCGDGVLRRKGSGRKHVGRC
jgi:hypothetical protein